MPNSGSIVRGYAALALLAPLLLGCQREAPGPEECALFAEAWVVHGRMPTPAMQANVDTAVRECLTRPYDRELMQCVLTLREVPPCWEAFRRRKGRPRELSAEP